MGSDISKRGDTVTEAAMLSEEVRRIWDGETWHGPALRELLDGLSTERAAARPFAGAHTIWELVLHVTAWTNVFRRRIDGESIEEPEEGDFPPMPPASAAAWEQARARVEAAHVKLAESVARLSSGDLEARVAKRPFAVRFQVHAAIRHTVYHSGQIGLLRKTAR